MAVKSKAEILKSLNAILGDNTSDEALALIEDVNDSFTEGKPDADTVSKKDYDSLKEDYDNLDKTWREKYRNRFFNTNADDDIIDDEPGGGEEEPLTYEALFEVKEG